MFFTYLLIPARFGFFSKTAIPDLRSFDDDEANETGSHVTDASSMEADDAKALRAVVGFGGSKFNYDSSRDEGCSEGEEMRKKKRNVGILRMGKRDGETEGSEEPSWWRLDRLDDDGTTEEYLGSSRANPGPGSAEKRVVGLLRMGKRPVELLRMGKRPEGELEVAKRPVNLLRMGKRPVTLLRMGKRPVDLLRMG